MGESMTGLNRSHMCGDINEKMAGEISYISRLCDQSNVPFASNIATAEMLILGLARGDLDWRMIVNPASNRPIA